MTIALGILASDGVVIAGDCQETYDDGFRVKINKIYSVVDPGRLAFAAVGAGTGDVVDGLSQRMGRHVKEAMSLDDFECRCESEVSKCANEGEQIRLIYGASLAGEGERLWITTSDGRTMRVKRHEATGAGETHAKVVLRRHLGRRIDTTINDAVPAAILAVYEANAAGSATDCGFGLNITVLRGGDGAFVPESSASEAQAIISRYWTDAVSLYRGRIPAYELEPIQSGALVNPRARQAPQRSTRGRKRQRPSQA